MNDWKIGTRLGLGFALVLALAGRHRRHRRAGACRNVARCHGADGHERSHAKERLAAGWLLSTSINSVRTFALRQEQTTPEVQAYCRQNMAKTSAAISETQKKLEELLRSPEEKALSADIERQARPSTSACATRILKLKADGKQDEAKRIDQRQLVPMLDSLRRQHPQHAGAPAGADRPSWPTAIDALYRAGRMQPDRAGRSRAGAGRGAAPGC